ncbi:MAG: lanthionine synthetase LanC family protein, partial [Ignavibacteria bacterium]|nr:lanthionine synthetase LanC family protein [Ignavibacteria bacterium]
TLLLNASFIDNLGLMHGKMGIAIYFFHLARETENQIYEDYAGELIDEIYDEIDTNTPLDFENGLGGIGWGIEYLVQKGFIEADTDKVLESIDNQLHSSRNYISGIGLLNGLVGLGYYYLKRIQNVNSTENKVSTLLNKQMLVHLIDELELRIEKAESLNLINSTDAFNLLWNYSVLISFLGEVYQLNLFNFKVERMIQYLITPLYRSENIPEQHSKRLQLGLALKQLQQYRPDQTLIAFMEELIQELTTKLKRETILNELTPESAFLINGTSGIAWIYQQLFLFTNNEYFRKEYLYWNSHDFGLIETDTGYAGFFVTKENANTAFGLLNGIAGINIMLL